MFVPRLWRKTVECPSSLCPPDSLASLARPAVVLPLHVCSFEPALGLLVAVYPAQGAFAPEARRLGAFWVLAKRSWSLSLFLALPFRPVSKSVDLFFLFLVRRPVVVTMLEPCSLGDVAALVRDVAILFGFVMERLCNSAEPISSW